MIQSSISLYRNAYRGLSTPMWWLALVMLVNRAGTMVIPFMAVYLRDEMHFTISQAGMEIAIYGTGALLGNFLGGKLSDKLGFYPIQFWTLFLNGVMFIILGQMRSFWSIAGCMFVTAIIGEAFRPANAAAIAFYSDPDNRIRSYSLNRLAVNLGFSIGPAIGGLLAFKYLFWTDGLTCIIAALLMRMAMHPVKNIIHNQDEIRKSDKSFSVWNDAIYLRFMFFVFLVATCFLLVFSMLPLYYKEEVHFSKSTVGILLALNGFIIAVTEMVLVYKLEGRRSPIRLVSVGAFLIGLSYALLTLPVPDLPLAVISMFCITAGEMLMFPFINTFWVARSSEHNRAQYASVYSMAFALAQIVAPAFGAQVVHYSNYFVLWFAVFGICFLTSFGFSTFKKHHN